MPVYLLGKELSFPAPEGANEEGIVAVGGDTSPERLLAAYRNGIFPWPADGYPLLWFSPDPRFTLLPQQAHVPRSVRKALRRSGLRITADTAFERVIEACASVERSDQEGTWITDELREGYIGLHERGHAHSIEAWSGNELVGGLYGVSVGRGFAGESMFSTVPDASKIAFVTLLGQLTLWDFSIVDCQVPTDHLARFGAKAWPRAQFLEQWRHAADAADLRAPLQLTQTPEQALSQLTRDKSALR